MELAKQAENVLRDWEKMTIDEKQAVAHIFIERIVVSQAEKHRVADVVINWRGQFQR